MGDEDAVTGTCRHDLPLGAAMAEAVAECRRLGQLEDLDPGAVVELENDDPGSSRLALNGFRFLRPRW